MEVEFLLCPFVYAVFTKLVVVSTVVIKFTPQCFILVLQEGEKTGCSSMVVYETLVLWKLAGCWGIFKTFRSKVLLEVMPFHLSFFAVV